MPTNTRWPESYGFSIYGDGPCYVVSVDKGSVAQSAGISPGDQLLELDGHNVTDMSSDAVKTLAKHSRTIPPTLGVVSRIQYVELIANRRWGYGVSLRGVKPTLVDSVDPPGPAYQAGLRSGDIVLELNGQRIRHMENVMAVLGAKLGKITLAMLPVENRNLAEADDRMKSQGGSRVRKARDLFAKMNIILGNDFEKKMAVVALLKQYAADRDVDSFSHALSVLLLSSQHRNLVRELRPFIPVKQRAQFDAVLNYDPLQGVNYSTISSTNGTFPRELQSGHQSTRPVTVDRLNGSFGFVLRGHDPVYVESAVPGGPADRAGIKTGDIILKLNGLNVRKCSHNHLVQLLQGSGNSPTLEVSSFTTSHGHYQDSSATSETSSSSQDDTSGWLSDAHHMVDMDGNTFKQKVNHLLTRREKSSLRRALVDFNANRNIRQFVEEVEAVLDTPSKKSIWGYLLPRLSQDHQNYVYQHANIPKHQLQEILTTMTKQSRDTSTRKSSRWSSDDPTSSDSTNTWESTEDQHMGSFKQQIEYLLTSRERSELRKALQIYSERRNAQHLLEDLEEILDTPSKRTLWFYIIPLLSANHQRFIQRTLGLPEHVVRSTSPRRGGKKAYNGHRGSKGGVTPRDGDVVFQEDFNFVGKPASMLRREIRQDSSDDDLYTKAARQKSKGGGRNRRRLSYDSENTSNNSNTSSSNGVGEQRTLPVRSARRHREGDREEHSVTVDPVYAEVDKHHYRSRGGTRPKIKIVRESSAQTTPVHSPVLPLGGKPPMQLGGNAADYRTIVRVYDQPEKNPDIYTTIYTERPTDLDPIAEAESRDGDSPKQRPVNVPVSRNGTGGAAKRQGSVTSGERGRTTSSMQSTKPAGGRERSPHNGVHSDADSEARVSDNSFESFHARALTAIQALDEVVAHEQGQYSSDNVSPTPPAPPPPPPPLPPLPDAPHPPAPPPFLVVGENGQSKPTSMKIKRMNWEKIEKADENTVWAKLGVGEELNDIVKYLELEQQFSTKKTKISESFRERKSEVNIISHKKAYNISILLGHLKLPVNEIKEALLQMNQDVLSPELLKQLLTYTPDSKEMEKYDAYQGSVEDLSKPDQFVYQVSRVPGYEERLKATLFKVNFDEKVDEVKQNLKCIRKASHELRHSKKLSKILELVLAMGNYMNKGNARVGQAVGFRISFLAQLDLTKTTDGKGSFLHVLADTVATRFPQALGLYSELSTVAEAAKVSHEIIELELSDLRQVLQEISTTVNKLSINKQRAGANDRFHEVMEHFISRASNEIQELFIMHTNTIEEFKGMVTYFGEDAARVTNNEIFANFSQFIAKFEKAHNENVAHRREALARNRDLTPSPRPANKSNA